jgi:integrase
MRGNTKYFMDVLNISPRGDAQIHKIPNSQNWYFKMWIPDEKRQIRLSLKTTDQNTAFDRGSKEYGRVLGSLEAGKKLFGRKFSDVGEEWLEEQSERVKTQRITKERWGTLKSQIRNHIVPYIQAEYEKNYKVGSLKPSSFYNYAQYRRKKNPEVREVTIRNEHTTIGALVKWLFRKGYTVFEKCDFEEIRVSNREDRRDAFTPEEWRILYRFLRKWVKEEPDYRTENSNMMPLRKKDFIRNFILLAANNMMRVGELRKLKWSMTETFKKNDKWLTKYTLPKEICKNRKERVFICRGGEYLRRIKSFSNYTEPNDFVFCNNDDGKQISKTEFYRMWWDIIGKVPIEGLEKRKITPYSLRHTAITFRLYSKVTHYEVAKDAGTSVRYIEEHYEHLDKDKLLNNAFKSFRVDEDGLIEAVGPK